VESFRDETIPERVGKMFDTYKSKSRLNEECADILEDISSNKNVKFDHDTAFMENVRVFGELLQEENIVKHFEEKKTTTKKIQISIDKCLSEMDNFPKGKVRPSHQLFTPQLMNIKTTPFRHNLLDRNALRLEQNTILDILSAFDNVRDEHMSFEFVRTLYKEISQSLTGEYSELNISMFNNGIVKNAEYDRVWKERYHIYRDDCKKNHTPTKSFIGFLKMSNESVPNEDTSRVYRQKMFKSL